MKTIANILKKINLNFSEKNKYCTYLWTRHSYNYTMVVGIQTFYWVNLVF